MSIELLRCFFGWCTIINMGLLIFALVIVLLCRKKVFEIHGKMFKLTEQQFNVTWYAMLAFLKICVFVFNVVPYVALVIMS